jgi:REP element-mobilizing transposase RayT
MDPKRPLHVTLRATQARGARSMLNRRFKARIFILVHESAKKYGVKVYRFTNVGNHLHLLVLTPSRQAFQSFLRVIAGGISFLVTGTRKGRRLTRRFWDKLAYSRVISWGSEFRRARTYLAKNLLESLGIQRGSYRIVSLTPSSGPPDN